MNYPWYELIENSNSINQGDLIEDCPLMLPPKFNLVPGATPNITVIKQNVIILSQSCDLVNNKITLVVVSPYRPISNFITSLVEQKKSTREIQKIIEDIKKGFNYGYHIIEKESVILNECQVVDFKNVFSVNIELLKTYCQSKTHRLRLLPPYREHLAQSFARFFMRVGLPQDIKGC